MSNQQPIKVCEEAFLRCGPWTPITFRLQRNRIVKTKPGEERRFFEAIKCLEAFGIPSDIDSVCAHLKTFKGSEIAKRLFCKLRDRPERDPWNLPAAVDLSVAVEERDTTAYRAKRIFKEFLRVFLSLCQKLIEDNQSLEQRLKDTFIDVFEGLTDSNFSLEPESNKKRINKKNSISYAIHLVHRSHRDFPEYYKTMTSHLAFLAPERWGMYKRGNKYTGNYTNWDIPETFRGFELDTDSDKPRDWDAMQRERIAYVEKPALPSPLTFNESLKEKKRTKLVDSSCPEEEELSLPKISRKESTKLTLRQFTPPDIADETPPSSRVSSPIEEVAFNYEGLDTNRESGSIGDDVKTRNVANMETATTRIFNPQPSTSTMRITIPQLSTSREEEKPSTSRQGVMTRERQESTSRLEERPSRSFQEEQSSATLNYREELMIEIASTISTIRTDIEMDFRDDLCLPSTLPYMNTVQEEETTPQNTRDVTTERSADVKVVETNGITASSGSATGGISQASLDMDNVEILNKASQRPDVSWVVDNFLVELIDQKCKRLRKKYDFN